MNCFVANGCGGSTGSGGVGSASGDDASFLQECNLSVGKAIRNTPDNELDYVEFKNHIEEWAQMRCAKTINAQGAKSINGIYDEEDLQLMYTGMAYAMCTGRFDSTHGVT